MNKSSLLKAGIIGTLISAVCCFTPILVIILGGVGLSALVGWLDVVLIPALLFFVGLTIYGLIRQKNLRNSD